MTNRPKHTPLPWSKNEWPQHGSDLSIGAVGTPIVVVVPLRDQSITEQEANIEFIVRACNMHYKVLAALKALVERYGPASGYTGGQRLELLQAEMLLREADNGD